MEKTILYKHLGVLSLFYNKLSIKKCVNFYASYAHTL